MSSSFSFNNSKMKHYMRIFHRTHSMYFFTFYNFCFLTFFQKINIESENYEKPLAPHIFPRRGQHSRHICYFYLFFLLSEGNSHFYLLTFVIFSVTCYNIQPTSSICMAHIHTKVRFPSRTKK